MAKNWLAALGGLVLVSLLLALPLAAPAQDPNEDPDEQRNLWPTFKKRRQQNRARPRPATASTRPASREPRPRPQPATGRNSRQSAGNASRPPLIAAKEPPVDDKPEAGTLVGYTFWREVEARPADEVRRLRRPKSAGKPNQAMEMTLERISGDKLPQTNDEIRLSFEVSAAGWLYVINREKDKQGKSGAPYLIYGARGDDNQIAAGELIYLPSRDGEPFTAESDSPDVAAEQLTVILAPQRLAWLEQTQRDAEGEFPLTATQTTELAKLEKQQGQPECEGETDTGQRLTAGENAAAQADENRRLKRQDKPPQTLCRVTAQNAGSQVVVTLLLRYASR